jgi:hypothetical protein
MSTQISERGNNGYPVDEVEEEGPEESGGEVKTARKAATANPKGDFYTALREARAELEDLQGILDSIRRGKTIIPTYADYIETTKDNLRELMAEVNAQGAPEELGNKTHAIRHLNNAWEQMQVSPLLAQPKANYDLQQQLHYLDLLDDQIHRFIYQIGELTIPKQINEWLKITRPGYFIPFHEVFADDLPRQEDREQVLKMIALTPRLTPGGFVDVENGRIYRYSTNPWRRLLSLGMLVLGLAMATGIVAASTYLNVEGWPLSPKDLPKMMTAWAAVLIGMGVHIVVGSAKRSKTQNGMPSVLMDLILIIDARFGEIAMKLLLGLIGLFGLVIISTSRAPQLGLLNQLTALTQVTPLNAFLVGYSLDSILELFGTNLEGTSQVKSLMRKGG